LGVIVKETLLPIEEVAGRLGLGRERLYTLFCCILRP